MKQIKDCAIAYDLYLTHLATNFITEDPAVISFIDENWCRFFPFINDGVSVFLRC